MFAPILAGFLAFTFLEWAVFAVAAILLIASITTYSDERYGPSFVCLLAVFAGAGFITHTSLLGYFAANGILIGIVKPVAAYLVIGLIVSLINWIMYVMRAKDKYADAVRNYYDARITDTTAKLQGFVKLAEGETITALAKKAVQLQIALQNQSEIFGRAYAKGRVNFALDDVNGLTLAQADALVDQKLHDLLPPKALRGINILSSAVFEWPITILSLLFSRFLHMIVNRVLLAGRALFDFVSRVSFGSHDVKL